MEYQFLIDTYETERMKTLSVWSMFKDEDMRIRPRPNDRRGRNALEHMVHQCVSENLWFRNMLEIDVGAPPLPKQEARLEFIKRYAEDSGKRLAALQKTDKTWWEKVVSFFERKAFKGLDYDQKNSPFCASSWAIDGDATHVGTRNLQYVRSFRRYRWPDDK